MVKRLVHIIKGKGAMGWRDVLRGVEESDTIVLIFRQTAPSPVTPQDNVSQAKLSEKSQDRFVQKLDTVTQLPQFEKEKNYNQDKRSTI